LEEKAWRGAINLIYFDQSGFNLLASVVYAWQEIGTRLEVRAGKSRGQSVLGFIWQGCERFSSFVFEGSITSHIVIYCINEIVKRLDKPTVLVTDNAPIHTSEEFEENLEKWETKGLTIYYLCESRVEIFAYESMVYRQESGKSRKLEIIIPLFSTSVVFNP